MQQTPYQATELAKVIDLGRYRRAHSDNEDFMEFLQRFDALADEELISSPTEIKRKPGESFWHSFYNND